MLLFKNTTHNMLPLLLALSFPTFTTAFAPLPSTSSTSSSSSSSRLYISSWTSSAAERRQQAQQKRDPEKYIQDYVPAPDAVEARSTIEGTLLVTGYGMFQGLQRHDQFLLDLLHHQESAFEFDTIELLVPNAAVSKKSLLSRSARYTGLLDALQFTETSSSTTSDDTAVMPWPTVEQLQAATDLSTWLVIVDHTQVDTSAACAQIASLVQQANVASLQNVALLITNYDDTTTTTTTTAIETLAALENDVVYTVVAVGELHDGPEGAMGYQYRAMDEERRSTSTDDDTTPSKQFSREEAFRIMTELLQLECGSNKALVFTEMDMELTTNATETKLIKGLREAGYARMQEMDHMIREGPTAYDKTIDEWRNRNPDWDKGYTSDIWWEAPEYKESRARSDARAARLAELDQEVLQSDIEILAKEWARREYFTQTVSGAVDSSTVSEEEYIVTVWEQALQEGEWAYRKSRGELTPEEAKGERKSFQEEQAKKQQVMLKKAKEELAAVMKEDLTKDKDDEDDDDDKDDSKKD